MKKLINLIDKRLNQHKLGGAARAAEVIHAANQLLHAHFEVENSDISATQLKKGVLLIQVSSAVWSQELWGYQESLVSELQKRFGPRSIQSVRMLT